MTEQISSYIVGAALVTLAGCFAAPFVKVALGRMRRQGIAFALIGAGFLVSMAVKPTGSGTTVIQAEPVTGASSVSVKTNGQDVVAVVSADKHYYTVETGALVTVTWKADQGYQFPEDESSFPTKVTASATADVTNEVALAASDLPSAIDYEIIYNEADGSEFHHWAGFEAPDKFSVTNVVTLPVAANLDQGDYLFNAWTNAAGAVVTTTEGIFADLTVYADVTMLWSVKKPTVANATCTVYTNDTVEVTDGKKVIDGATVKFVFTPQPGYVFEGQSEFTTTASADDVTVDVGKLVARKLVEYTFDYTNATIAVMTNSAKQVALFDDKATLIEASKIYIGLAPEEGYAFGDAAGWQTLTVGGAISSNGVVQATDQTIVMPRPALTNYVFEVPVGEHVTAVVSNETKGAVLAADAGKYTATYFDVVRARYTADEGWVLDNGDDQVYQITNGVEFTEVTATMPPVVYRAPIYKEIGGIVSPTNGIAEWVNLTTNIYTVVEDATATVGWNAGWYVVTNDVTLSEGAMCNGAVHLILADGAKLTANVDPSSENAPITVFRDGDSLTIYGQKAGTGQLIATGVAGRAGIGGNNGAGVNITINGGTVTAQGGDRAAGIGGGNGGGAQNIVINGGTVTAKGGEGAAGIGGGLGGKGQNIWINGGEVKATAGQGCSNAIGDGQQY